MPVIQRQTLRGGGGNYGSYGSAASQPWARRVGSDVVRRIDNIGAGLQELQQIGHDVDAAVLAFNSAGPAQRELAPGLLKRLREQKQMLTALSNEADDVARALGPNFRSNLSGISSELAGFFAEVDENIAAVTSVASQPPPVPLVPIPPSQPLAPDVLADVQQALGNIVAERQRNAAVFQQYASGDAATRVALKPQIVGSVQAEQRTQQTLLERVTRELDVEQRRPSPRQPELVEARDILAQWGRNLADEMQRLG